MDLIVEYSGYVLLVLGALGAIEALAVLALAPWAFLIGAIVVERPMKSVSLTLPQGQGGKTLRAEWRMHGEVIVFRCMSKGISLHGPRWLQLKGTIHVHPGGAISRGRLPLAPTLFIPALAVISILNSWNEQILGLGVAMCLALLAWCAFRIRSERQRWLLAHDELLAVLERA